MKAIPNRLVLLSFDDGNHSDLSNVAPLLRRYAFGATFFITEGLGFLLGGTDGGSYLSWDEVRVLHDQGFEIGNHTKTHPNLTAIPVEELPGELTHIQVRCVQHGIRTPTTFCYPGFHHNRAVVDAVAEHGFIFARRGVTPEFSDGGRGGRGPAYDPRADHPLLIPTTGYAGPAWTFKDLAWAIEQARDGKIASLCYHGVPDPTHPWVSTEPETFADHMRHLYDTGCTVISFRDLSDFVDPTWVHWRSLG